MTLPEFPHFSEIELSFSGDIREHLRAYPLEASEYTFTNLFAFGEAYNFKVSMYKGVLMILKDKGPVSLFCPVGGEGITDAMDRGIRFIREYQGPHYFERVPESFIRAHLMNNENFIYEEERDHFDYVYDVIELIELKGRKFHDKKNRINAFRNSYKYEYASLTPELVRECLEFEHYWCEVRDCRNHPGLRKEQCAIYRMLRNFNSLDIRGGIIRVGGRIAALTLGEKLLSDTMVIHVEKANSDIPGLYQAINQEFLMHEAGDCRFVNREQDLGVEGLRNAKMSYNPIAFVKKYKVWERRP
ncbi:MAG: phosphatidylglycerol lysyltransferase domain-containing protein [Nitrospirota bacterium]